MKKGTICSECYACKGHYALYAGQIIPAQRRRLESLDSPQWIEAMVTNLKKETYFRWFDSGDLQSVQLLENIKEVARQTPHCKHWVSTRERRFVRESLRLSPVPDNLVIRISATYPDVPVKLIEGVQGANVHKNKPPVGFECRAPYQFGKCDDCRACWYKKVPVVSYKQH